MSPTTGKPAYKDCSNNRPSIAWKMERQHGKGLELFVLPHKSQVRNFFKGFRRDWQEPKTEGIDSAADSGLRFKNRRTSSSCKCKLENGDSKTAIPLVGFIFRSFSGACLQLRFLKQLAPKQKLEAEMRSETNVSKRRFRLRNKVREVTPFEDHLLLFMSSRFDAKSCSSKASFCGCNGPSDREETLGDASDSQFFCEGGFLHACPVETAKVAQTLCVRRVKLGCRRKRRTLGFACLHGQPLLLGPDCNHTETHFEALKVTGLQNPPGESQRVPFAPFPGLSLETLMARIPLAKFLQSHHAIPDKERLTSVQDFFRYTESEGKQVFQELDRNKDGQITLDDLKFAMEKMKLPSTYANKLFHKSRSHWLAKSFGWPEFSSLIQEKEPMMIRLFNSLGVSNSGTVQRTNVKVLLKNAGLPATEGNACAMMKFLGANTEGLLKYGQFRKFMLLVPSEQLTLDPWSVWFKAATSGSEASRLHLLESIFHNCSLLSRGFVHRFESAKVASTLPDVKTLEDVSNLFRLGNFLSHKQLTVPGADILELKNEAIGGTELQLFKSCKGNISDPILQSHHANGASHI